MPDRPEYRDALLRRLATDLRVVAEQEPTQRPTDMECCWVRYEKPWPPVPGRTATFVAMLCDLDGGFDTKPGCAHQHHKGDVFLA